MARPIFIVGAPRSGTTYLGNIFSRHRDVAVVKKMYPMYSTILESWYFSKFSGRSGELTTSGNMLKFMTLFSETEYFKASDLDVDFFLTLKPKSYSHLFKIMMDKIATNSGKKFWLEKTPAHAFHLDEILEGCPNAKIIVLKRNIIDQINSIMNLPKHLSPDIFKQQNKPLFHELLLLKRIMNYVSTYHYIREFNSRHPEAIMVIPFEKLKTATPETVQRICHFTGLTFLPSILSSKEAMNTSFASATEHKRFFSKTEILIIKIVHRSLRLLPFPIIHIWYQTKSHMINAKIPPWMYKLREAYIDHEKEEIKPPVED